MLWNRSCMYYYTERNRITIAFFAGLPFSDDGLLITLCNEVSWWIPSSYLSHEQVALYSISFWDVPGGSASILLHCMEKQSFSRNNQLKYKGNQQVPPNAGTCLPNYTVSNVILVTSLRTWNQNCNTVLNTTLQASSFEPLCTCRTYPSYAGTGGGLVYQHLWLFHNCNQNNYGRTWSVVYIDDIYGFLLWYIHNICWYSRQLQKYLHEMCFQNSLPDPPVAQIVQQITCLCQRSGSRSLPFSDKC